MKSASIGVFALSALAFVSASNVLRRAGQAGEPEFSVSYAVGVLLVPVVLLIIGVALWNRQPKPPTA